MTYVGVAQINQGWQQFVRENPGLAGCTLRSTQNPDGTINLQVNLGGVIHTHVMDVENKSYRDGLKKFLEGLVEVAEQRGGRVQPPEVLPGVPKPGRRRLFLEEATV